MSSRTTIRIHGSSVVDFLMVFTAISLLCGLAMPYLLQMRSEARWENCAQKLRNIALAAHNFHDTNRRMPPATLGYESAVDYESWADTEDSVVYWQGTQNTSSLLLTAPFMDMKDEYDKVHKIAKDLNQTLAEFNTKGGDSFEWQGVITGVDEVMQTTFNPLLCPEDDLGDQDIRSIVATQPCQPFEVVEMDSRDECRDIGIRYWEEMDSPGLTNYVGCMGVVGAAWSDAAEMKRWRGAMTPRSRVTLETFADGTSRTIMYGESLGEIVDSERRSAMSWLWGGGARVTGNWPYDSLDRGDDEEVPIFGNEKYSSGVGFGSKHDNGITFALCDGSVRRIARDVNHKTLFELAGAQDGGVPLNF